MVGFRGKPEEWMKDVLSLDEVGEEFALFAGGVDRCEQFE